MAVGWLERLAADAMSPEFDFRIRDVCYARGCAMRPVFRPVKASLFDWDIKKPIKQVRIDNGEIILIIGWINVINFGESLYYVILIVYKLSTIIFSLYLRVSSELKKKKHMLDQKLWLNKNWFLFNHFIPTCGEISIYVQLRFIHERRLLWSESLKFPAFWRKTKGCHKGWSSRPKSLRVLTTMLNSP